MAEMAPADKAPWWHSVVRDDWSPSSVDLSKPSVARVYDHLLGGKDNFAVDREVGDRIKQALPEVYVGVREQRAVLRRVVRYLVREAGIRQLVDIGSGLPTAGNVHEIASEADSPVRVVYVDNNPIVLAHARALLVEDEFTTVVDGDVRRPRELLDQGELRRLIDFEQPVGLLLCGILHHLRDDEDPFEITRTLVEALPSGSFVFVHHLADDGDPGTADAQEALREGLGRGRFRTYDEVGRFFDGLDMIDPGLVHVPDWHPDPDTPSLSANPVLRLGLTGVARTP